MPWVELRVFILSESYFMRSAAKEVMRSLYKPLNNDVDYITRLSLIPVLAFLYIPRDDACSMFWIWTVRGGDEKFINSTE